MLFPGARPDAGNSSVSVEESFGGFFRESDDYSKLWRERHFWSHRVELCSVALAATAGVFFNGAVPAVLLFVVAGAAHLFRFVTKADQRWWNGRAGAESAKTLMWRYSVGGNPLGLSEQAPEIDLTSRLRDVSERVAEFAALPLATDQISTEMRTTRSTDRDLRVNEYLEGRIKDQQGWYERNSKHHSAWALRWSLVSLGLYVFGAILTVFALDQDWDIDFLGVLGAFAAAAVAWNGVQQHEVLTRAYSNACGELTEIAAQIADHLWHDEAEWADFVDQSEEAISREHTSWRASRNLHLS